jgi:hypothetical protein
MNEQHKQPDGDNRPFTYRDVVRLMCNAVLDTGSVPHVMYVDNGTWPSEDDEPTDR